MNGELLSTLLPLATPDAERRQALLRRYLELVREEGLSDASSELAREYGRISSRQEEML